MAEHSITDFDDLKVPPHSTDAERAVIGGLLLVQSAWDKLGSLLTMEDFYHANHRFIFQAIEQLHEQQEACDVVTVSEWLEAHGLSEKSGGLDYLADLAANTPGASNIEAYGKIVREKSVLRNLIEIGNQLAEKAFNPGSLSSDDLLEEAESLVFKIREQSLKSKSGFHDIKEVLSSTVQHIQALMESGQSITGLPYPWHQLNELTAGMHKSDLIIIAGRPAMGKTSFAMNIAEWVASNTKLNATVAIFSMEMAAEQIVMRMFSSLSQVNQESLKTGQISDREMKRIAQSVSLLNNAKLYINDTPAMTPNEMMSHCRRLKNREGLDLIVIDYLQLMQTKGKAENRVNEISEISRNLKAMAKELNVPVIALSQLSRAVEQRPNKRPMMSDLRESGAIEQDADLIMFIYRDEAYKPDTPKKGIAEVIVGKHRNGQTGAIELNFIGSHTRFVDLEDGFTIGVENLDNDPPKEGSDGQFH